MRPSSSNRNRDFEEPARVVDHREYPTLSDTQRDYSRSVQPAPRSAIPQFGRDSNISSGTLTGTASDGGQSHLSYIPQQGGYTQSIQLQPLSSQSYLQPSQPPASPQPDRLSLPPAPPSPHLARLTQQLSQDSGHLGAASHVPLPVSRAQSPLPVQPQDQAYTRNSRAFLGHLDFDMPSATDFLAASDLGGFEEEVELPVPPRGTFPELEGTDSERSPKLNSPQTSEGDGKGAGRK